MTIKKYLSLSILLAPLVSPYCFANDKLFAWPNGTKAAVSLGYDDALNSQLDNVIPTLDKYRVKGTFYLTLSNESVNNRMSEWRQAAINGHELANHTLFHQCSRKAPGREWVTEDQDLDKITVTQLAAQIRVGNTLLHAIDGKTERTFTTPCGDLNAGGTPYIPAIKDNFVAIKAIVNGEITDMKTLDPYAVGFEVPVNVTGKQLIAIVKAAATKGTMTAFTFHGVGGDYLTVSKEAHDELVKYLAAHKDIYWTDSFLNIMKYVKEQQKQ